MPIRAVHDGWSAVSASRATQSRISSSVVTTGPGDVSPPLYGSIAGWLRMCRATRIGLDPLAAVLVGREVVEAQRRVVVRVGRLERDRAAGVGIHRPDVDLVAVTGRAGAAVVADGQRQEVEHQVRVGDVVVAPREPAALEMVRRARSAPQEQPLARR